MSEIDEAIGRVEHLLKAVSGKELPPGETVYAPIPAEKDPSRHVEEQVERLVTLLSSGGAGRAIAPSLFTPPLAVLESENEFYFNIDLPGTVRDQIVVTIQGNVLTVTGQRPSPATGNQQLRASEHAFGAFRRAVPLPPFIRAADLQAQLKDGVLEVRIPKDASQPTATPRVVPVK